MALLPSSYDDKDKTWSGPKRTCMYNYDTSLGNIIFNTLKNWPKNVCQISDIDGIETTNGQCVTWAIRIAQHLKKRDLNHEHIIGIAARNSTYVMPLAVACLMNATPFHAVNPLLDEATTKHVFQLTKPILIFCDGIEYTKIHAATIDWHPEIYTITDAIQDVPHIKMLLDPTTTEMFYKPETLVNGCDQTVAILSSSGTTGLPKAVGLSNCAFIGDNELVTSETIGFVASGLDWITGMGALIASAVNGCTRIITNKPFTAEYFVQLVKKYKINMVILPPRHLSALITCQAATQEALASIRMLNYGGGFVSMSTLKRAQAKCKNATFCYIYGLSEIGNISVNIGLSSTSLAGKPFPGTRIRIVDEDGKRLASNEVGEIFVHTGRTWNGYYGNPIETRRMQDLEGWFHTGDLGYFDEQHFLHVVDRKKDILKYEGLQYSTTEIENVVAELPQLQDVCVVGIYSERYGDAAGALVVKHLGCEITEREIVEHVAKRLPGVQKQLHAGVRFTEKLPTSMIGKTLRKAALEVFIAQSTGN